MRRASSLTWLTLLYGALVAYASLYPFGPWERPAGLPWREMLNLPWPRYWSLFDVWANALGYVPWGFLAVAAVWRQGGGWGAGLMAAVVAPSALAYGLEVLQFGLPTRVPSLADWALNTAGAALGALLGAASAQAGWLARWAHWRDSFFLSGTAGGLTLLALWPLGLVFPPPLPLAQGQWVPGALQTLREWGAEVPWGAWLPLLAGQRPSAEAAMVLTGLGVLAPCLVMLACARPGWHRGGLVLALVGLGVGMSSLSAALNFGPAHAWSWPTPGTGMALAAGGVVAAGLALLPARVSAVLALPVLTALLVLVNGVAPDAYWQRSLAQWQLGPRVHLIGLFQWIGWLWPLVALLWTMARLMPADQGNP